MANAFLENPLGGLLGVRTAVFFRLNKLGLPVEPVFGVETVVISPNRIPLDMIDNESPTRNYSVTENPLQDLSSASSNVHKELETMSIVGTLTGTFNIPFVGTVGGPPAIPGFGGGLRLDLLKLANLEHLADRREPLMVVTPRKSMPKAFISSITPSWDPESGENTIVTIGLVEARIVNPLSAEQVVPDVETLVTGNNAQQGAGAQSPAPVDTQTVTEPLVQGQAPLVSPVGIA